MDNFITDILKGKIVLGTKEEVVDGIFLIPIYRVKISFLNVKADVKNTDGISGNVSVSPIGLIKISNNDFDIIKLEEEKKEGFTEILPKFIENIDLNNILTNLKI